MKRVAPRKARFGIVTGRCRAGAQDGVTLLEMVIALALAAIIFLAVGATLIASTAGTLNARQTQQAADFISEKLEGYRGAGYAAVAMRTPLGTDARLLVDDDPSTAGVVETYFDPDDAKTALGKELIVTSPAGVVIPRATEVRDGTRYDIATYVTVPADAAGLPYKRVTTVVTWRSKGAIVHERRASTAMSQTQRGLPLPEFFFEAAGATDIPAERGTPVTVRFNLTNIGARDRWKFTFNGLPTGWGAPALTDMTTGTDITAGATVGPIETDETRQVEAYWANPPDAVMTFVLTVVATSVADATVSKSIDYKVSITEKACAGCNWKNIQLHNSAASSTATTLSSSLFQNSPLYADLVAPVWAGAAPDFDTNRHAGEGRVLEQGGVFATEAKTSSKLIEWRWALPSGTLKVVDTDGDSNRAFVLNLCLKNAGNTVSAPTQLSAQVFAAKASTSSPISDLVKLDLGGISSTGYACYIWEIPVLNSTSGPTWDLKAPSPYKALDLRLTHGGAAGEANVVIAYDSSTYPAILSAPTL